MMTPHELFNDVMKSTGDRVAAIRTIRERFGLELWQAKEVMLQAEGVAASLDEHQGRIAVELERLIDNGVIPSTDLEYWASLGNLDRVRKAFERSPDPNVRGVGGYTAIHAAAENGHLHVLRLLVENGGNINVRLDTGETPLKLAESAGQTETVAWLKSHGAK